MVSQSYTHIHLRTVSSHILHCWSLTQQGQFAIGKRNMVYNPKVALGNFDLIQIMKIATLVV